MGGAVAEQCCEEWLPCNGPGAWVAVRGPSGVGGKQTQFRPQCSASPTAAGARTDGRGLPPPLGQFLWKEPGFVHRGTGAAAGEQDPLRHLSSSSSICSPGDLPPLPPMGAACTEGCKASGLPGVSKWHWSSRVHGSWCVAGQKKSHSQPLLVTTLCFLSSPLGKSWQLLL